MEAIHIDLTQIILGVITIICGVVARYLIPWIKDRLSDHQRGIFESLVKVGVFAAEQLYKSDQGQQKKQYVVDLLEDSGYTVDVPAVDALIEATVKELKIELQK